MGGVGVFCAWARTDAAASAPAQTKYLIGSSLLRGRLGDDLRPFLLADHADSKLFGFLELRAGAGTGDDQVGLGADRARRARAEPLRLSLGLVAAHRLEAAGEDDGLAAPFGLAGQTDERLRP